jgi:hypothetical protein
VKAAERILDGALLVLALALPLSIAATEISLGVATLAWLGTRPWSRAQAPWVRPLAWATLALAAAWLLASATSATPLASFVKARKLWSIVLVFILADRMRETARARRFTTWTLAAGTVTCAIGILVFALRHARGEWREPLRGVFSTAMTTGNVLATLVLAASRDGAVRARRRIAPLVRSRRLGDPAREPSPDVSSRLVPGAARRARSCWSGCARRACCCSCPSWSRSRSSSCRARDGSARCRSRTRPTRRARAGCRSGSRERRPSGTAP